MICETLGYLAMFISGVLLLTFNEYLVENHINGLLRINREVYEKDIVVYRSMTRFAAITSGLVLTYWGGFSLYHLF